MDQLDTEFMCDRYQQDTLQFNMSAVNSGSDTEDYSGVDEPTLLEKFKRILDQYRNDVQIIKELVQNADDATATRLKILYDGRNINKEETGENPYRKFLRGPALAFFNDAKFSEKDWKGIKSINKSIKKDAPLKIGQFGLGFKSIFHLTDYPCIISGDRLLFLNPQEKNENKICTTVKLRKIRKGKHHETRDYLNALDGIFGFSDESFDSGFNEGTIFWFPLRQTPSGLSDSIYTDSQVYDLLQSFLNEAHRSLIFLQTLCDIELFVNLPQMDDRMNVFNTELLNMNYGKDTPCFKTQIDNKDKNLVHVRKAVLKELEETAGEIPKTSKDWVHDVEITIYTKCKTSGEKVAKSRWLVVNYLKGGEISKGTTDLMNIDNCKISHLVGFAASINEQNDYTNADGHVFCYQPLPQEYEHMTGLPVHVNGFFALSQDRRHIRWPDHEDTAHGERKVQWNIALTNEIMPDGYCRLFEEMINLCKYENNPVHMVSAVYHTFPDFPCVKHPWKNMAEMSLAKSTDIELAFTNNSGGRWIRPFEAVFVDRRIDTGLDVDCLNTIINLLLRDEVNVVVVSDLVLKAFEKTFSDVKYLTPLFLKTHLLNNHVYKVLSPSEKEDILQFVLQDSTTDCLDKLELLPLADGTFTNFSSTVFLEGKDIIDLFSGHSKKFISPHIRTMTREQLCSLSESFKDVTCIHTLSDAATASLIEDILRSDYNVKDQYRNYIRTDAFTIYKFEEWLKTVWTLIQSRFRKSIGMFICLPIFPVYHELKGTSQLSVHSLKVPTLQVSSLMNRDDKDHVFISFQLLSIVHFDSIPRWIDSGLITQYIHTETSDGLVALLSKIDDESIQYFNQKTSPEISSALLKYLSEGIHFRVGEECKRKVYSLKLFTAYLSAEENELVCLEQQNGIYNGRRFPVRFPDKTIVLYSVTEIAFAERIEANFISEYDLVSTSLNKINVYPYTDREKLIRWIIKEEKYLEDELIRNCIIKTEFLLTEDGKVHMPQCLFDPTDKILANVFKNQHSIPLVDDNDFQYISGLRRLGLKSRKDLGIEDIERQCDVVHEMAMGKTALIKEQCQSLLVIMNDMPDLINLERLSKKCCIFLEDLNKCNRKSNVQIPSKLRKNPVQICLPMEIKSMEFSALISSVSYTIDCDLWPNLSKVFCWSESPNVEDVANQLLNIVKIYETKLKPALLPIITNIYEWFAQQDRHDIKLILEGLFSSLENTFVWVGNGFRAPNQTYVERNESDTDMQPFAHLLPDEVQHLSEFFIQIGCRKCFSFEMLVSTLYQIKHCIDRGTKYEVSSEKQMLRIVVDILKKIKQEHLEEFLISNKELYFPIVCSEEKSIELKPTNECTFCDAEWLRHVEVKKVSGIYYVHPDVPISTAEALGVPPLTRQMLSDAEAFEEWGQEEPLTRRLRTLLKDGYVDGFSIAKELFQNADDARANKLWIMYDERENNDARSNLLSEKMAELQGPAIWIYNEAKFNSDDLNNIRKLYGETKKEDATKIGKFGLGFCAVYNVTDVPSFVTGSHFVIFDPHTTFLGKALEGNRPGLKINLNGNLIDLFRNQFKPFESVFGCKLTNGTPYFDGTLFRLPLRNRASDICDTVYTSSQVKELFAKIMSLSANMLIFNQQIHEIKIFHTPKSENDPAKSILLFELSKKTISLTRNFNSTESIVSEVAKRKEENSLRGNPLMSLEKIEITGERHYDGNLKKYRRKNVITGTWLISWSTGTDENFFTLSYKEKGALPIGAVAVPIKFRKGNRELEFLSLKDVERNFYKSGHLFFFLPLPIEHRFPFHINGQFSITSDRRQLRTSNEDDIHVQMKNWNENLLKDPVTQSLLYLLENVNRAGKVVNYKCYQLWPRDETATLLRCFTQSFYEKVVLSSAFKVFEKNGQWFDISECVFIDSRLRLSDVGNIIFEFLSLLTIYVVDVPEDVYQMLLKAGEKLIQSKTVSENAFFLKYFLPNLEKFGKDLAMTEKRNKLLCHAIQLRERSINEWVRKNPCIPSRPLGILKSPTAMIDSRSQLAVMFEETDNMFPEKIFEEEIIRAHLHELGLMNDTLTDYVLLDKAKSIKEKQKQCNDCAFERSGHILLYMNDKREQHGDIIQELQQIEFIPIKSKPKCWPFQWYADVTDRSGKPKQCLIHKQRKQHSQHNQFIRASDMYHYNCRNIVGTLQFVFPDDVCNFTSGMRKYNVNELKAILKKLGMKGIPRKNVDYEIVSKQLQLISADWNHRTDNTGSQEVENIVVDIYIHLNLICENETVSNKIRTLFDSQKVVWILNTFVPPQNVASSRYYMDCSPYLFKLSASPLDRFKPLCKCLGITEYFEPNYVAMTLRNVHTDKGNTRLTGTEIRTVINILHCLNESIQVKKKGDINYIFDDQLQTIYGPDDEGILRDMKQMCFNDFFPMVKSASMIYSHALIPMALAEAFGVKPKKLHYVEEGSEDIEDFCQEEPLVVRLNRLVENYPCDNGIFKELIQNADDAQATEIHFLKDYVTHPIRNILDKSFAPLQGPALCVFNNSAFTKEDLKGIQRLGVGSKSDDPLKTGKYGVGFNAVYNMTDAPSFYSKGPSIENGDTLCFFDPLANFLPNVSRRNPGRRYKRVDRLRKYKSDVMKGYHEDFFLKTNKAVGTVFRLPLRTSEMAKYSDIKQESIDMETVSEMLDSFCEDLKDVVIFLKNLKTIRVSSFRKYGHVEDFIIDVQMTETDETERKKFVDHQTKYCRDVKNTREKAFQLKQMYVVYELQVKETIQRKEKEHTTVYNKEETYMMVQTKEEKRRMSRGNIGKYTTVQKKEEKYTKYIVVQTIGFKQVGKIPHLVYKEYLNGKIGLLPHGGVALCIENTTKSYGHINAHNTKNKAFCFLPLPIETGLPVNVHGYFSLDHETRRGLWKSEHETECYRTLWNLTLIEQVIAPAYVFLLEYTKKQMFQSVMSDTSLFSKVANILKNYQTLFPVREETCDYYWKHLLKCVYQSLVSECITFLPVLQTTSKKSQFCRTEIRTTQLSWTALKFPDFTFQAYVNPESSIAQGNNKDSDFNNALRAIGMRITTITENMMKSMAFSEVVIEALKPKHVIDFMCSFKSPSLDRCKIETNKPLTETDIRSDEALLSIADYCLKDVEYFISNCRHLPLMMTQDCVVRTLQESQKSFLYVDETGLSSCLFPTKQTMFLHTSISCLIKYKVESFESRTEFFLKQFTLQDFVTLVRETGQLRVDCIAVREWDQKDPSAIWIRTFWKFFHEVLSVAALSNREIETKRYLQIVKDLPLIPAVEMAEAKRYLVKPHARKRLIDIDSFKKNEYLHRALKTLKLLEIDQNAPQGSFVCRLLLHHIPNLDNAGDIVECLHLNMKRVSGYLIPPAEAISIVRYFDDFIGSEIQTEVLTNMLCEIPIFVTHFEKCVAIKGYAKVCVAPSRLLAVGLEGIATDAHILMLRDIGTDKIFKKLNISKFDLFRSYTEIIIPNKDNMERESFYKHLEFLADFINFESDKMAPLISMLKNTHLIDAEGGVSTKISELFDPLQDIFKVFCKTSELLPARFRAPGLLRFFRLLGLKTKMTKTLFERFARQVEARGNFEGLTQDVKNMSDLLLKTLFLMDSCFYDSERFEDFAKIKFIVPNVTDGTLSNIHKNFNSHRLICFDGSVVSSSITTCWTVMNILPEEADPTVQKPNDEKTIIEKFKICEKPHLTLLLQHCENVGRSVYEKLKNQNVCLHDILHSLMDNIYSALSAYKYSGKLDKNSARQLENVPIIYIPEIKEIVVASTIVISCNDKEEIRPFLNKCPDEYIQYKDLFLTLGSMREVSCDAYAYVLFSLKELSFSPSLLLPKEKSDAIKAMGLFFKCLTHQQNEANINKKYTCLLSENFTFEDARNLIIKNNMYFHLQLDKASNLQCLFLLGFDQLQEHNLKMENCIDSLRFLPIQNRPYLLTDIVHERVVLRNIVDKDGKFSRELDYFIHSSRFIQGFLRLVRHSWRAAGRKWTATEEIRLVNHLQNITFRHATGIETLLAIRPVENGKLLSEQLVENTNEAKGVHLEQNNSKVCVFFDSTDDTWFENVKTELTVHLNEIVGSCLKDKHFMRLREIIGMKDLPDRISWYLSKEKIEEYDSSVDIQEAVSYPKPGTFVPKELYHFLDNGYGEIHEYEYKFVALEIEDPAFNDYTEGDTGDDIETDLDPTYIFVHVVRQIDSDVKIPLFQEYEIDDGTENLHIVKAYQLFKFIRKKIKQNEKKKHSEKKELDVETQLVIYARNKPKDEVKDNLKPQSLKDTLSEIRFCLQEAWKQPEVQKRKIVKRLLLKWHPDKNHDNVLFCTKVFQYIQQCIRRLENGLNLIDADEDESGGSSDRKSDSTSSEDFWSSSWFGRFWERHEKGRQFHEQRYKNRSYDEFDGGWNARGTFFAEPESKPFPYHAEARRWLKQAKSDLDNSTLSLQRKPNNSFNWVCYMAHQAAEKSMKAAWYAKDANKIHTVKYSHNLNSIASELGSGIESLARSLTSWTGEHTRMRYPDAFCGQRVPEEAFNRQTAETVVSVAKQIIDTVQSNYIR